MVMTSLKGTHKVVLGESFTRPEHVEYHSYRYDFKPASLDPNQRGVVEVGAPTPRPAGSEHSDEPPAADATTSDSVSVFLPNVVGTSTTHTAFKGNRRAVQKECFLVVNKRTGQISIERVSTAVQLKKTRDDIKQPNLVTEKLSAAGRQSSHHHQQPAAATTTTTATSRRAKARHQEVEEMSSSSSSDEEPPPPPRSVTPQAPSGRNAAGDVSVEIMDDDEDDDDDDDDDVSGDESDLEYAAAVINDSVLQADLHLSESGSDSD